MTANVLSQTGDSALRPVPDRGWRNGLANLVHNELRAWWGTKTWLIQALIWTILLNGFTALVLWTGPRVGPLAIIGAVVANVVTRYVAGKLLAIPPEFEHLDYSWISGFTAAGVAGAVLTFAVIGRVARRPIRLFRTVSAAALVFSFVPDIALLITKVMPGTNGLAVDLLMVLHVVAAVVSVGILTTLGRD